MSHHVRFLSLISRRFLLLLNPAPPIDALLQILCIFSFFLFLFYSFLKGTHSILWSLSFSIFFFALISWKKLSSRVHICIISCIFYSFLVLLDKILRFLFYLINYLVGLIVRKTWLWTKSIMKSWELELMPLMKISARLTTKRFPYNNIWIFYIYLHYISSLILFYGEYIYSCLLQDFEGFSSFFLFSH